MMVETIPARAASNDAQLLKDAQRVFKALPKGRGHGGISNHARACRVGTQAILRSPDLGRRYGELRAVPSGRSLWDGRVAKGEGAFDKLNKPQGPTVLMQRFSSRLTGAGIARA